MSSGNLLCSGRGSKVPALPVVFISSIGCSFRGAALSLLAKLAELRSRRSDAMLAHQRC